MTQKLSREMRRYPPDESVYCEILKRLPDLDNLSTLVLSLTPDFVAVRFKHDSNVPQAAACFQDSYHTLEEARYALQESICHKFWYLKYRDPPDEMAGVLFSEFYADDTALRLYSAGEHLASAIEFMLEIPSEKLGKYKKDRISRQSIIGRYLIKEHPSHPITKSAISLETCPEWKKTREYRNQWVHEQPPIIKGQGITYNREAR